MLINILIRTMGRDSLKNTIDSIKIQDYQFPLRVIILSDAGKPEIDIPHELIEVERGEGPYFYNGYCNLLKSKVESGVFFFLDDDDTLCPGALDMILITSTGCDIVQFNRGGWLKPSKDEIEAKQIINGRIGMPCLILDAKYKDIADIPCTEDGDFLWICDVVRQIPHKFHNYSVVYSERRRFGNLN